jgi:hypothetical protein
MATKPKAYFQVLKKDQSVYQSFLVQNQKITFGGDNTCDVTISRKKYKVKHHATLYYDGEFIFYL